MSTPSATNGLTIRSLAALFLPLALSGAFFPIARPIINAALARTEDAELSLAAYSVGLSLMVTIVAPLFGMRHIVTALSVDQDMIRRLGRVVLSLAGAATTLLLLLSIPSVFYLVTDSILGIPAEVAARAQPAMWLLATAPLLMTSRAYFQGILVHWGRANSIGVGSFAYLAACTIVVFAAVIWLQMPGAIAAALALFVGNVAYVSVVAPPTRPLQRGPSALIPRVDESFDADKRSTPYILSLYHPLALSNLLASGVEPVVQMAMARLAFVTESLAAYAVCVSIVWLARTNLWNTQQVVIARVRGLTSYRAVRRFVLGMALGTTVLLAVVLLPPVSEWVFGDVAGLQGRVKLFAQHGYALLLLVPGLQGWRSLYYGTLVTFGSTRAIRTAAIGRIMVLLIGLGLGVQQDAWPGIYVAAAATLLAELTEVGILALSVRRVLRQAPTDR